MSDSHRTNWPLVVLIYLGALLAASQFGKISLTLGPLATAFGRDIPSVSLLVSLVGVMGLLLGAMAGGIVAAFGPGRSFLFGLILGGAVSVVEAVMPPFWAFAGLRALEGVSHLALVVAGPPLMAAAASDRDRPLAMGLWGTFFGLALAGLAAIIPTVLETLSLGGLFAIHGGAMLVLALVMWRPVPRVARQPLVLDPVAVHKSVYGTFSQVAPGIGFVCYTFLFLATLTFLPKALGLPASAASFWSLITLATTLGGGAACRFVSPWVVSAFGFVGALTGTAMMIFAIPGGAEVTFAFLGLVPGASFAAIAAWNDSPAARARSTGAIAQFGNVGTVTGTPVLALAIQAGGRPALLGVIAALAMLGAVLAIWSGRRVTG